MLTFVNEVFHILNSPKNLRGQIIIDMYRLKKILIVMHSPR